MSGFDLFIGITPCFLIPDAHFRSLEWRDCAHIYVLQLCNTFTKLTRRACVLFWYAFMVISLQCACLLGLIVFVWLCYLDMSWYICGLCGAVILRWVIMFMCDGYICMCLCVEVVFMCGCYYPRWVNGLCAIIGNWLSLRCAVVE